MDVMFRRMTRTSPLAHDLSRPQQGSCLVARTRDPTAMAYLPAPKFGSHDAPWFSGGVLEVQAGSSLGVGPPRPAQACRKVGMDASCCHKNFLEIFSRVITMGAGSTLLGGADLLLSS